MAVNPDDVRSALQLLAGSLLGDVERLAERGATRMQELLPSYARLPRAELVPVTRGNMRNLLERILDPEGDRLRDYDAYRASGETRAPQGITSDEMLHAWRIGLEVVREEAYAVAEELEISKDALLAFVDASLRWGDIGMRASASAHHEAEIRELGRLVAEQAALRRVATLVAQRMPSEEFFKAVSEQVGRLLGADLAGMSRYEADDSMTIFPHWSRHRGYPDVADRVSLKGGMLPSIIRDTGRPARQDAWEEVGGPVADLTRGQLGIRSTVGSPIVVESRVWGALFVSSRETEHMPEDTESRLENFTKLIATAIANAQARAEVERLAQEQAALRRVATLVAQGVAPEEVFAAVVEEAGQLLRVDSASLARYESDRAMTNVASWGEAAPPYSVGTRVSLGGDDLGTMVAKTGRPARIERYADASGPLDVKVREAGMSSSVGTPIIVEGHLWGLVVASTSREEPLPADSEARLASFTELVATAIANAEGRAAIAASRARIVAAADETRRRIERDLHDGAQQRQVHAIIMLKLALRALKNGDADATELTAEALRQAELANSELRELAHGILPAVLTRGGLRAGVEALRSRVSLPIGVDVSVGRLPDCVEATTYFVISEALTNVVKHARAARAAVTARAEGGRLRVEIRDDGIGGADPDKGSGLVGLRDRIEALGGRLEVSSPVGEGTTLRVEIPLERNGSRHSRRTRQRSRGLRRSSRAR